MKALVYISFFFYSLVSHTHPTFSLRPISDDPCKTLPHHETLRSDQLTILINGYSESRIHLLRSISIAYSSIASVAAILILWGNTATPLQTLNQLSRNLTYSSLGAPISVLRQPTQSLNARFLPRLAIKTRAVAVCDDDVEIDTASFEFAFKIWSTHQDRLIGFFPRSHDLDLSTKTWIYTVHPHKYSILLTKLMILNTMYLEKYSCGETSQMRNLVDGMVNCEDILMNFVVSNHTNSGPVLVEAMKLRDHGDARNLDKKVTQVGLSSRRRDHRRRRGDCIRAFHKVMGKMPLKYSYGRVVSSVGEQGLCNKGGGKLVLCDGHIL